MLNKFSGNFLGSGWAFPVKIGDTGSVDVAQFERSVAEAIRIILGTSPGERLMRPDFGCRINDMVFAPNNSTGSTDSKYMIFSFTINP